MEEAGWARMRPGTVSRRGTSGVGRRGQGIGKLFPQADYLSHDDQGGTGEGGLGHPIRDVTEGSDDDALPWKRSLTDDRRGSPRLASSLDQLQRHGGDPQG